MTNCDHVVCKYFFSLTRKGLPHLFFFFFKFIAASKRHVVFHSFDIENQIFQQQRVVMFTHGKIEKVIAVEGKIVLLYDVNKLCVLKEEKQNITKRSVSTFSPFKDSFCTIR